MAHTSSATTGTSSASSLHGKSLRYTSVVLQWTQLAGPVSRVQSVMSSPSRTQPSSCRIDASSAHCCFAGMTSECVNHNANTCTDESVSSTLSNGCKMSGEIQRPIGWSNHWFQSSKVCLRFLPQQSIPADGVEGEITGAAAFRGILVRALVTGAVLKLNSDAVERRVSY